MVEAIRDGRNVLVQAGRRWGKSRCGTELLLEYMLRTPDSRCLVIVPQHDDVKKLIEALNYQRVRYDFHFTMRRLTIPGSKSRAYVYSAERPEALRGFHFDFALLDEVVYWEYPREALDAMEATLVDTNAKWLAVTTPPLHAKSMKGYEALARLTSMADLVVRGKTSDNVHLSAEGLKSFEASARLDPVRYRVEWLGEVVEDPPLSLFPSSVLKWVEQEPKEFDQVVVGVDPTVSDNRGDEAGIVTCARVGSQYHVLRDYSGQYTTEEWAERVRQAVGEFPGASVIVEQNQGGVFVERALTEVTPDLVVRRVHASVGKVDRALPISALYAQGRVTHSLGLERLERQLRSCVPGLKVWPTGADRLDAAVHALTYLSLHEGKLDLAYLMPTPTEPRESPA